MSSLNEQVESLPQAQTLKFLSKNRRYKNPNLSRNVLVIQFNDVYFLQFFFFLGEGQEECFNF